MEFYEVWCLLTPFGNPANTLTRKTRILGDISILLEMLQYTLSFTTRTGQFAHFHRSSMAITLR